MTTDLTLVVTAHDETAVCGPTMRSADLAVAAARRAGRRVQTVVALAAPTEATRRYFAQPRFDHWERRDLDERDPSAVRNAVVRESDGRFTAFLAADGLISENWLVEGAAALLEAADRGVRAIAHPELTVAFDAARSVLVSVPQDSPVFTAHHLYAGHCYGGTCLAPREAHLAAPYAGTDPGGGSVDPDLRFTIETLDAGWQHIVVRDTIGFERRRDESPAAPRPARAPLVAALPGMAIDRVRRLGDARDGRRR